MKDNKEDIEKYPHANEFFNLDEIPERELFANYVSYSDKIYTFGIYGCILSVDGKEDVTTVDIVLHPNEVSAIRDYFFLRGKHWESSVSEKFKEHSPELFNKINAAVQNLWEQSDEYASEQEDLMMYGEDADFERIELTVRWPEKLFEEMDIHVPNVSIWVINTSIKEENGAGYPIYLEPEYYADLKEILKNTIWGKSSLYTKININNLADKHKELRDTIEVKIKDMLVYTYDFEESTIGDLEFCIWYYSIYEDANS